MKVVYGDDERIWINKYIKKEWKTLNKEKLENVSKIKKSIKKSIKKTSKFNITQNLSLNSKTCTTTSTPITFKDTIKFRQKPFKAHMSLDEAYIERFCSWLKKKKENNVFVPKFRMFLIISICKLNINDFVDYRQINGRYRTNKIVDIIEVDKYRFVLVLKGLFSQSERNKFNFQYWKEIINFVKLKLNMYATKTQK